MELAFDYYQVIRFGYLIVSFVCVGGYTENCFVCLDMIAMNDGAIITLYKYVHLINRLDSVSARRSRKWLGGCLRRL